MISIATMGRETSEMSAPRKSTACEKATKCGVGLIVRITHLQPGEAGDWV